MRVNRWSFVIGMTAIAGCTEPFEPELREPQEVVVINGMISDVPGTHEVEVSRSAPYDEPVTNPVDGCVVSVIDELGERILYRQAGPGLYRADLPGWFLSPGKAYSLQVNTMDGAEYRSAYDTLLPCPPVDTLYYELQQQETSDPDVIHSGLQFYADIDASRATTRNFRWLLEETWEYRAPYIATFIWFGGPVLPYVSDSLYVCYRTMPVKEIRTASTRYLTENRLKRQPFLYVSNQTPKLKIKYSLLVTQQSLSNDAFSYWNKLESQSGGQGGLYETQPSSAAGNLYNAANPDEKVLGFFYATQQRSKRLTVENTFDFDVPGHTCTLDTIQGVHELDTEFPYYLFSISPMGMGPPYTTAHRYCFDCTVAGGETEKPGYW